MAMSSEAYDFSLFETRYDNTAPAPVKEPKRKEKRYDNVVELPQEQLEKNRRPKRHPVRAFAAAIVFFGFVALGAAMVHSQEQLAMLTEQINTATETLQESQSLEVQLNMRAAQTMNASQVEEYAAKLGMSKVSSGQITYVNVAQQDKGAVLQTTEGGSFLDRLAAKLKSLLS